MDHNELLDRLNALLPAQFDAVVFRLKVPAHILSSGAAQGTRAVEVLRYLMQRDRLGEIHEHLEPRPPAAVPAAPAPSTEEPAVDLAALRRLLATLYPSVADRERAVHDAGLRRDLLDLSGTPLNAWFAVLHHARLNGGLDRLVRVAIADFSGNADLRRIAVAFGVAPPG